MQSTNALVRRAALVLGLAGFALMTFYVVALFAAPAQAKTNSSASKVQYQQQDCQVIVGQRNRLVNSGDATAVSANGNATAAISQKLNVPVSVVQNCLQAGGDINLSSGGGETSKPSDGKTDNSNTSTSNPGPGKVQYQSQSCSVIVSQYNNLVNSGNAKAVSSKGDAVATVSQEVNAPVNVVQNCLQAGGNINSGGSNNGGTNDGETTGGTTNDGSNTPSKSSCPSGSGTQVATLDGSSSGVKNSNPFQVTGGNLLITATSDPTSQDPSLAGITVYVVDAKTGEDATFGFSVDGAGTDSTFEKVKPGTYYLSANAANTKYSITAEDCPGQSNPVQNGSSNPRQGLMADTIPPGNLPDTGGTTAALVPATPVSVVLIPVGGLLILSSLTTLFWLSRRSAHRRG